MSLNRIEADPVPQRAIDPKYVEKFITDIEDSHGPFMPFHRYPPPKTNDNEAALYAFAHIYTFGSDLNIPAYSAVFNRLANSDIDLLLYMFWEETRSWYFDIISHKLYNCWKEGTVAKTFITETWPDFLNALNHLNTILV